MSYNYDDCDYDDYRDYKNEYSDDGGCDGGCDNGNDFDSQSHHHESTYSNYEPPSESDHGESIYNKYGDYEEINKDCHGDVYDDSACASQSDDADWDHPPSELNYHDHKLTSFNCDHHNQDPPPSGHYHDNPSQKEMNYRFAYRGNKFEYQEDGDNHRVCYNFPYFPYFP